MPPATPNSRSARDGLIRKRIANACDGCKSRKVKCDGRQPCTYCIRRQRSHACHYTPNSTRTTPRPQPASDDSRPEVAESPPRSAAATRTPRDESLNDERHGRQQNRGTVARPLGAESAEDDTEVPREARLLCDAQGKLIFIGDTAPLSLFQSVRQLVTSRIGQNAFAPETSRYSVLENAPVSQQPSSRGTSGASPPSIRPGDVSSAVANYVSATTGLIDLFDDAKLADDVLLWVSSTSSASRHPASLTTIINYLILAIGRQKEDEAFAQASFDYARTQAFATLSGDLGVGTVQAFVLVTVYMLCSCQINSAFLVFGISVRAAYSIGVHRTEVNARFGPEIHRQRDRLWKSLRVLDLFLSTSMGRPPATSDVDCTVPYRSTNDDGSETFDLLNASVQILLIMECIVVEVYSRKKISLQSTEGMSLQLREWSARWLQRLKMIVAQPEDHSNAQVSGACHVLSSYYYAVMLVSRPFLMYELFRRLSDASASSDHSSVMSAGKSKLADACIDAASLMVDILPDLINRGYLNEPMPLLVSWIFASSLVLGVGLLGGFGRILEKHTRISIQALDHFAKSDTHATQYSLIAQSLLTTALEHLESRELQERQRRTERSSQLFGFITPETRPRPEASPSQSIAQTTASPGTSITRQREPPDRATLLHHAPLHTPSTRVLDFDSAFFGAGDSVMGQDANFWTTYQNEGDDGSTLNLFPLLDAGGGIDLAHYL